jgi:hypothetical protein
MPAPTPNSTGSIANVRLIVMISSFNFVFVYKPKMQELLRLPKDLRRFASTVVRLRFRKTPIVEHLPNDPSTRAAWIRVWKFPNQNSCLNFRDHMKIEPSVCTRITSRLRKPPKLRLEG